MVFRETMRFLHSGLGRTQDPVGHPDLEDLCLLLKSIIRP
jgi:hypothetical protein